MVLVVRHRAPCQFLMTFRQQRRPSSQKQDGPPSRISLYRRDRLLVLYSGGWRKYPQQLEREPQQER